MLKTYEAVLEPNGQLHFLEAVPTPSTTSCRVLVTFTTEQQPADTALCGASLSEAALAEDWLRNEEDAAWAHLQLGK
ncbi:MAG: hypothetical protein Q7U98_15460 [Methylicorpusculum sp.]|uniref:hypothetical protein n=1 Tax=Methylicorpusculum sp. TaxID=2713644 RepID=UPI00271942C6|nr:hypothetical protein [Methylicorpusculum sp.]MDO8844106.1 hypothetical protein [Methylicorpusculum sp.]MDO8940551.1 hypothetical protein [Methylicorpusculum sp.]MDP2179991.1 hypothetical protein [Methylicorpusculum sp.]MDP2204442.1 hypothetical protein [Methylicorpusculum sp.]MDP3527845.1 hypothetical protein [Methylicorpusculum sp.]